MVDIGVDYAKKGGIAEEIGAVLDPPACAEDLGFDPYLYLHSPSATLNELLYLICQVMGVDDDPCGPHSPELLNGDTEQGLVQNREEGLGPDTRQGLQPGPQPGC
jgi:hypothetical protein